MKAIYFTLTGTKYEYGDKFMEPDMSVSLVKEPDNKYDKAVSYTHLQTE